jgi:hypothetical protein
MGHNTEDESRRKKASEKHVATFVSKINCPLCANSNFWTAARLSALVAVSFGLP